MGNRGQKRTENVDELPADKRACSSTEFRPRSSEGEKDSPGSCESDNSYRDYCRRQLMGNQGKFKEVLSSLSKASEESALLAALTELCDLLSFSPDSSMSNLMADSFSPVLGNDLLCEVHPRSSAYLVNHDAVPALCQRLMAIEYLDVAEQKISREQPIVCLHSGAIMAVLSYIDFLSTSVQRKALLTVVNICKSFLRMSLHL
ncbi:E3 ubiquitin-protein ligase upl4 [Datura stramonium]|uniref:HECT-type E3 ubiquitin transferase n=1 Tax=Datura stramonium TaxID=4076 RepID=A0ABS8V1W9_DATST|nr:E3 ubiquitin-protein ligase upl4 [Datura stramonium]